MNSPLHGVRVLDLTRLLPGPFATWVLVEMGAQVDKIEDPHGGDYLRHMPPQVSIQGSDQNAAFVAMNRDKRSLVVDLKRPEGQELLLRILSRYDVLIEGFRPGVLARLGLGHDRLRAAFPRLIIASLSGYGQTGPLAQRAGHDINYIARSGILGFTGPADAPPQPPGFQLADIAGAMWCVIGILGALRARDQDGGSGSVVDIAMSEATLPFAVAQWGTVLATGMAHRGGEALTGGIAPYNTYATRDGHFVALGALEPKFWRAFCEGVGLEVDMSAMFPGDHQRELKSRLCAIFATRTRDEWARFGAERDCCLEPILGPGELVDDEHLAARGVFDKTDVAAGDVAHLTLPVSRGEKRRAAVEGTVVSPRRRAPTIGEHSDPVLADAGLTAAEIQFLRTSGVVA